MRNPRSLTRSIPWGAVVALMTGTPSLATEAKPDLAAPPVELEAKHFVPDELIVGGGYKLDPMAVNDGFVNTYTLSTDWGEIKAVGDYRLRARIQEVQALRKLDEMSRAGVFGDALKDGVLAPVRGAGNLITSPVKTTTGAVRGVGRWIGNVARSATSDDPHQEGALSSAAGWAATKRGFALELGVDPNTDWEPLEKALVSVGRAAFAGGITASVGMGMATEGTAAELPVLVLSLTDDMNQLLLDNPPELLTGINRKKLEEIGVDEDVTEAFLRNYNYTPMEKTLLVDALARMAGAKGREKFVVHATGAPDKDVARYMQQRAEMMANFHAKVAKTDIVDIANEPWQLTPDGRVVGLFPLDFVLWTAEARDIVQEANRDIAKLSEVKSREIWLEGRASKDSRQALDAEGWLVKERVGQITGKPLQSGDSAEPAVVSPGARGAARAIPN